MKSVFDPSAREELVSRINQLNENSKAQWGEMTLYQMLKHCVLAEESYLGKKLYKRKFLGYIFGKKALKGLLDEKNPFPRNAKTSSDFIVTDSGDFEPQREKWIELINEYGTISNLSVVHWFFGKMNEDEIGRFAYKHADHHLRQFGV